MTSPRGLRDAGDAYLKAVEESKRRMPRSLKAQYAVLAVCVAAFGLNLLLMLTPPGGDWKNIVFAVALPLVAFFSVVNIVSAHKNKTTTPEDPTPLRKVVMDHAAFVAVCLMGAAWSLDLEGAWQLVAIVPAVLLANESKERVRWFRRLAEKQGEAK